MKNFLEAGKKRLSGDTACEATSGEAKDLQTKTAALKVVQVDDGEIQVDCVSF